MNIAASEICIRLALAVIFGALIGVERQWHHKNAGVKTHTLVCLGSAGFSLVSVIGLGPNSAPTQLAVGVVTGIGFIGGGVIMHRGASIQGITTAATLWTTGSLGLALGGGYYLLSAALVVGILLVQLAFPLADNWIERRSPARAFATSHRLMVAFEPRAIAIIRSRLDTFRARPGVTVFRLSETRVASEIHWEVRLGLTPEVFEELVAFCRGLSEVEGVIRVDWSAIGSGNS